MSASPNLPALYWPLKTEPHPDSDAIDADAVRWMRGFPGHLRQDGMQKLLTEKLGAAVAHCLPHADPRRLRLVARVGLLGTAMDDWFESLDSLAEVVAATSACQRAWEAPGMPLTDMPYVAAFREVLADIRALASAVQYERIVAANCIYHQAIPWETALRAHGAVLDQNTYAVMRNRTVGWAVILAYMEFGANIDLPEQEAADPALRALREASGFLLAGFNDLASAAKEADSPAARTGLPAALMAAYACGPVEAMSRAIDMLNRVTLLYIRLRSGLERRAGTRLRQYLAALDTALGNLTLFQAGCTRYTATSGHRTLLRPEFSSSPPIGLDPGPLPIPAIAWWWEQ
ncbi:terpene synthase family protein [Streptomyces acidicola]|uniref:terpene synthase family protein n=1 Tax=Streptomyces acidicola TaxID=2596892 RepID=UPI0037F38BD1